MIKTISKYILIFAAAFAAAGCSDFLDKDNPAYDNVGFYKSEAGLKEGVTGVYQKLYFDTGLFQHVSCSTTIPPTDSNKMKTRALALAERSTPTMQRFKRSGLANTASSHVPTQ